MIQLLSSPVAACSSHETQGVPCSFCDLTATQHHVGAGAAAVVESMALVAPGKATSKTSQTSGVWDTAGKTLLSKLKPKAARIARIPEDACGGFGPGAFSAASAQGRRMAQCLGQEIRRLEAFEGSGLWRKRRKRQSQDREDGLEQRPAKKNWLQQKPPGSHSFTANTRSALHHGAHSITKPLNKKSNHVIGMPRDCRYADF